LEKPFDLVNSEELLLDGTPDLDSRMVLSTVLGDDIERCSVAFSGQSRLYGNSKTFSARTTIETMRGCSAADCRPSSYKSVGIAATTLEEP
jgi:hypothetical protein